MTTTVDNDELERQEHATRVYLVVQHDWEGPIVFTCSDCLGRWECEYAYDEWHLNGDCILDK